MATVTLMARARLSRQYLANADALVADGALRLTAVPTVNADEVQEQSGAMVALVPTAADAARLAVEGGEPADELHVTLMYLGQAADIPDEARQALITALWSCVEDAVRPDYDLPLVADGFSVSVFNPGDANDRETCVVLGLSGADLDAVHGIVAQTVGQVAGGGSAFPLPAQHSPWVPHITLEYTDDAGVVEELTDRVGPVAFDRLRVAFGGQVTDIPLRSLAAVDVAWAKLVTQLVDRVPFDESKVRRDKGRFAKKAGVAVEKAVETAVEAPEPPVKPGRKRAGGAGVAKRASRAVPGKKPGKQSAAAESAAAESAAADVAEAAPVSHEQASQMQDEMSAGHKLTAAQKRSVSVWSNGSRSVNHRSIQGALYSPGDDVPPAVAEHVRNLHEAMRPTTKPVQVFRGVDGRGVGLTPPVDAKQLESLVGGRFQNPGFSATSIDPNVGEAISDPYDVVLQIDVPPGTPAVYVDSFSPFKHTPEQELLLDAGTTLEFVGLGEPVPGDFGRPVPVLRARVVPA